MKTWHWLALAAAGVSGYVFVKKGGLLGAVHVLVDVQQKYFLRKPDPNAPRVVARESPK